ncbi:hypothetical protein [Shinella sp.]|uniref:hypothetical protein n=1 Tax=Shinella sp. TaxID=1870904 RepID=UPI003F6F1202
MNHTISRRGFMAASGASLIPASAAISASPTDDDRLQACIIEIRDILKRRYPVVDEVHESVFSNDDGTFRVSIQGTRRFATYSGEGVYEISTMGGSIAAYWLQKDVQCRISDGTPIPGGEFFWGRIVGHKGLVGDVVRMGSCPRIIRKLEAWDEGGPIE